MHFSQNATRISFVVVVGVRVRPETLWLGANG